MWLILKGVYAYKSSQNFDKEFNSNNYSGYKIALQISKSSRIKSFNTEGRSALKNALDAKFGYKVENDPYSHGDSVLKTFTKDKAIICVTSKYSKDEIVYFLTTPKLVFKKLDNNGNWQDTGINSRYIKKSDTTYTNGGWGINIVFNTAGKENFAKLTQELVGERLGIFYSEQLIGAPKITEPIKNGIATITQDKGFTLEEAEQMKNAINDRLDLDVLEIKENIK